MGTQHFANRQTGNVTEMKVGTGRCWVNASAQDRRTLRQATVLISSFKQQIAPSDVKYYLKKKSKAAPGSVFISLLVKGKLPEVLALRVNSVFITCTQL